MVESARHDHLAVARDGDALNELDETLTVTLSSPVNATIAQATGTVTIMNDDQMPAVSISPISVQEGNSGTANVQVPVTLSAASTRTITVACFRRA